MRPLTFAFVPADLSRRFRCKKLSSLVGINGHLLYLWKTADAGMLQKTFIYVIHTFNLNARIRPADEVITALFVDDRMQRERAFVGLMQHEK